MILGATGVLLARWLVGAGKEVALVERDPDVARVAANSLDCLVVEGDGSLPEILNRAGIAQARFFAALAGSDELNIVTCSVVAAERPSVRRIARVRNPYFFALDPARRSLELPRRGPGARQGRGDPLRRHGSRRGRRHLPPRRPEGPRRPPGRGALLGEAPSPLASLRKVVLAGGG